MVTKCHRLRRLQMGKSGHHPSRPRLSEGQERVQQLHKCVIRLVNFIADPEPEIRRHLIIARATGVQPPPCLTNNFGQARLNIHVNIFTFF